MFTLSAVSHWQILKIQFQIKLAEDAVADVFLQFFTLIQNPELLTILKTNLSSITLLNFPAQKYFLDRSAVQSNAVPVHRVPVLVPTANASAQMQCQCIEAVY